MATLTIRQLDDEIKDQLRIKAAHNQRSMEAEVRVILKKTLMPQEAQSSGLGSTIHALFNEDGIELELPERGMARPVPDFS